MTKVKMKYPIAADYCKYFLSTNNIAFVETSSDESIIHSNTLSIRKGVEFLEAGDMRKVIEKTDKKYSDFIDGYANHLKEIGK